MNVFMTPLSRFRWGHLYSQSKGVEMSYITAVVKRMLHFQTPCCIHVECQIWQEGHFYWVSTGLSTFRLVTYICYLWKHCYDDLNGKLSAVLMRSSGSTMGSSVFPNVERLSTFTRLKLRCHCVVMPTPQLDCAAGSVCAPSSWAATRFHCNLRTESHGLLC